MYKRQAYAQWPDKETFEKAGSKLSEKAIEIRDKMKVSGVKVKMLDQFKVIEDLLV